MSDTGYNTNQFYGIGVGRAIKSNDELTPDAYSNPPFAWPGPTRRHAVPFGTENWAPMSVQRGFIRMLTQTKGGSATEAMNKRRCFFQFNPDTLVRGVSMRSDIANPLTQDPSQFTVPVPGNTEFAFELMFDRSMELNRPLGRTTVSPDTGPAAGRGDPNADYFTATDPLLTASPNEIGVLADLRMLDTIIGQGITADAIDYILERAEIINSYQTSDTTVNVDTNEDGGTSETSDTTSTTPADTTMPSWDSGVARTFLSRNVGNQAFLIPNPVRVLFSSLFMVDGFVSAIDVNFVKFTEAMVPMQCFITLRMQALYIGFARSDTFLTYALSQATAKLPEVDYGEVVGTKEGYAALLDEIDEKFSDFKVCYSDFYSNSRWDTDLRNGYFYFDPSYPQTPAGWTWGGNNWPLYKRITYSGSVGVSAVNLADYTYKSAGAHGTIPLLIGRETIPIRYGFKQPENINSDPVYTGMFGSGDGYIVTYSFTLKVSRTKNSDYMGENNIPNDTSIEILTLEASETADTTLSWETVRKVKKDLTNNTFKNKKDWLGYDKAGIWARMMYPTTNSNVLGQTNEPDLDQLRTSVWNTSAYGGTAARGGQYIINNISFSVEIDVTGTVSDGKGNTASFYGRLDNTITTSTPFAFSIPIQARR